MEFHQQLALQSAMSASGPSHPTSSPKVYWVPDTFLGASCPFMMVQVQRTNEAKAHLRDAASA